MEASRSSDNDVVKFQTADERNDEACFDSPQKLGKVRSAGTFIDVIL